MTSNPTHKYELLLGAEKRHRTWIAGNQGGPIAGCYRCRWLTESDNIPALEEQAKAHEREATN